MAPRRIRSTPALHLDFEVIRDELELPRAFPPEVLEAADRAIASGPAEAPDATELDLVTIDPPGSRDLDQAVGIERRGDGWRVHYAIADVAAWVAPEGPIDREARRRTQTYYAPDRRTPLHPPAIGERAASLLPDGPRPAVLWTLDVDGAGQTTAVDLRRAMVRSRDQLTYAGVQQQVDAQALPDALVELPALGAALVADAHARGAIDLGLPEQEVVATASGGWALELRPDLDVERWNAQVSLLTGRAAAALMLEAGVGIVRTLPAPDPEVLARVRRAGRSLGIAIGPDDPPGAVLAGLDRSLPRHAAFAELAAELLRGAGYTLVDGHGADDLGHAGVGGPYAHVTAPLRRLVDRFATEVCLATAAGRDLPAWVDEALADLPTAMADGDRRARTLERAVVDATEALVLSDRVGSVFSAQVVEVDDDGGTVVLDDPPVRGRCAGRGLPLGEQVQVRCTTADVTERRVRFEWVP